MSSCLYLIRHTKPLIESGICYGQSEIDVAETFAEEAHSLKESLPDGMKYYSSPLSRCRLLAEFLSPDQVTYDKRLKELSFGEWEMKAWKDIDRENSDPWALDYINTAPPGGESGRELYNRVTACLDDILLSADESIGIITHAGCIRAMLVFLLKKPLSDLFSFQVDFGSVSKVDLE